MTKRGWTLSVVGMVLMSGAAARFADAQVRFATGPVAYAHVLADGTVDQQSGNVTVAKVEKGLYCIGVTGRTAHAAVASLDSLPNVGGSVQAGVFRASACPEQQRTIYVVTRSQAQDGGFPGADRAFYIIVE